LVPFLRKVAIVSAGMTKFGKHDGKSLLDLMSEAALEALSIYDSLDIDMLVGATMAPELYENSIGPINKLAGLLGLEGKTVLRVENTSGSGGAGIFVGYLAVASGYADKVLVVGGEKMTSKSTEENAYIISGLLHDCERNLGVTLPSYAALLANWYFRKYNPPKDSLAHVAIKNHYHGSLNPKAHIQKRITLEEYFQSKIVAEPLRVMDYTPISDGAASVLLMPLDEAYSYTNKPVVISAVVGKTDSFVVHERDELDRMNGVALSVEKALSQAGLRREDIDLIELHDMATILEIVELENMGFFKRGEGWRGAMEKITWLDGELPVNTSGGLKSKGHPIGATGVAHAYEVFLQMRREAGERQAKKNVSRALSMSMGGFGQNAYTIIYEAGW